MKGRLYSAGVAVLLTLLLSSAVGAEIEWVDVGGNVKEAAPQALQAPAGAAAISPGTTSPTPPEQLADGMPLDYVYIDPSPTGGNYWPWYPYYSGFRVQILYMASEIGRSGTIAQMAWFQNYYSYTATFPNVSLKLCHTSLSNLNTNYNSNYDGNDPVVVYHQNAGFQRGLPAGSWDTVDFQTNFEYNGTDNMVAEVTWIGSASGSGCPSYYTNTSNYRRVYASNISDTLIANGSRDYEMYHTRLGFISAADDVGVTQILVPAAPYYAFGDTIYPQAEVKNHGLNDQTDIPVHCVIRDKATGTEVYNDSVIIASLDAGALDTVDFPVAFAPVAVETVYVDTFWTDLDIDEKPENDWRAGEIKVTQWGAECLTYNDGTFDNAYSWVAAGNELAVRFFAPTKPLAINKVEVWLSSFSGNDYDSKIILYGNDGSPYGYPGTEIAVWEGQLSTEIWTSLYLNEIMFDPAVSVNYDTFFVSYYQTSIVPNYPYCGVDYTPPVTTGNDWGKYGGTWGAWPYDASQDFGINACYEAPLIDGSVVSIQIPAAEIDSNTTFTPQVTVANAGLKDRSNMVVVFDLIDSLDAVVYTDTVNTGPIGMGETKVVDFNLSYLPHPGDFTDSAYTIVQWDGDPDNDWFVQPLFVKHLNVLTEIVSPRITEVPGLVPVRVKLVNMGNVPALVPRLDVTIDPSGYADFREDIPVIPVGGEQVVELQYWVCPAGGQEVATAWITYPADMYPPDDTMIRPVTTGIPGWMEMTALPAPPSGKSVKDGGCMAYDAGTEMIYASKGYKTGDFYAYDVPSGTWATKTGIPLGAEGKQVYKGSVICSDGNGKLYLTKGNNTVGFWGYDAETNAWTQLTNVPFGGSGKKVKQGASIVWAEDEGVGAVYLLKGYRNEFYKYDPEANTWTYLLNAPIGRRLKWDDGSWLVSDGANKLYAHKAKYHEFYYYDLETDLWSPELNPMPIPGSSGRNKKSKSGGCAAWYGGKIYALKGGNTNEFWRYFPETDTWQIQDDIPLWGTSGRRKKVKRGASMAGYPGTGVYAFKGNKTLEFWRYTPYDVAGAQPRRDGVTAGSVEMGGVTFAIVPNPLSGGLATVRYSLPKAGLAEIYVFDVTGRTVLTQTLAAGRTGTAGLDLRELEAGVYLVKVTTEGFSATQKLVVEH